MLTEKEMQYLFTPLKYESRPAHNSIAPENLLGQIYFIEHNKTAVGVAERYIRPDRKVIVASTHQQEGKVYLELSRDVDSRQVEFLEKILKNNQILTQEIVSGTKNDRRRSLVFEVSVNLIQHLEERIS